MMSMELPRKLGYEFRNEKLLKQALTHRSCDDENNERLEFLGDAIVNLIIAEVLYEKFPYAQEGQLSRLRAALINRETLGKLGRHFDLGRYLHLGPGELKSGGSERESIVSCAMEAMIGAIYLDSDFNTIKKLLIDWYQPWLENLSLSASLKDPKTQLQEYLQRRHKQLPIYNVESVVGEAHEQMFLVSCTIEEIPEKVFGKGTSRRRAEQEAASLALEKLKK